MKGEMRLQASPAGAGEKACGSEMKQLARGAEPAVRPSCSQATNAASSKQSEIPL